MKQVVIRECAFRACEKAHNGRQILFESIREAFDGKRADWDRSVLNEDFGFFTGPDVSALHEAIAPDIIASVSEEPTTRQVFENVCDAIGECVAKISELDE